jgi:hypothetical protein
MKVKRREKKELWREGKKERDVGVFFRRRRRISMSVMK